MAVEPRPLKPKYAKPSTPKSGASRIRIDVGADDKQSAQDEADALRKGILSKTVSDRIRLAMEARSNSGIEDVWAVSQDLYDGLDASAGTSIVKTRDQLPKRATAKGRSQVILNITKPKTDIGVARVQEMLVPTDDKPWDMEPTPIPELDKAVDAADPNATVQLADGTAAPAAAVALKAKDDANVACEAAKTWVEDGFVEGNVYGEMRKVIRDAGRSGTGVLKGPFPVSRKNRSWSTGPEGIAKLITGTKTAPTSKCIRAADCFPDPACGESIHDGADFTERDFLTGKALRALAELPDYDAMAIAQALADGPQTYTKSRSSNLAARQVQGNMDYDASLFEVFYYYGDIQPEDAILLGMQAERKLDDGSVDPATMGGLTDLEMQLYTVPCVVTMLNGVPIKCVVNPMETGCFPYDFFVWDAIDGQPWGRGIPWKMAVAQRMLTASVRQMLENAGLSSGPQIAMVKDAMTPADGSPEITGRKLWWFTADEFQNDINKAMAVFDIPSMQQELQAMIEFALRMADQLTNLPMLMQGDQQAGTSPETLGGMKLLVQNATSPLRVIAKQFDDLIVIPHLGRWYDWCQEKGPKEARGDHQIVARGSTALVAREEGREFLMQLFPVIANPEFRIDPAKYSAELARSNGYNMKLVQYSDDDWKKKQQDMAANPPPPPPQVQVAQIRKETEDAKNKMQNDVAMTAEHARQVHEENDRALRVQELEITREIKMLELATKSGETLEKIKAQLAQVAIENRTRRDEMQLKLDPANQSHTGI